MSTPVRLRDEGGATSRGSAGVHPVAGVQPARTLGVEEEFLLVDRDSGVAVGRAPDVLARCSAGPPRADGSAVHPELRATQLEAATGICTTARQLRRQLETGRRLLAGAARAEGLDVIASGTPPLPSPGSTGPAPVNARFARIDELYGGVVRDYEACGCHVHVGVADRDTAVAVVNHLGRWLPSLLALSANSPIHAGHDTGYQSWRMVQQSRFPGSGLTPWFPSHAAYRAEVDRLVDCGVLADESQTFWLARPSPRLPTVELRVADTAATVGDAVLQALLSRALVRAALADLERGVEAEPLSPQLAAASVWSAARHGPTGAAVDPALGRPATGDELIAGLLDHVRPALEDTGDLAEVLSMLRLVRKNGTGAQRQRRAARRGLGAVHRMLSLGGYAPNDGGEA